MLVKIHANRSFLGLIQYLKLEILVTLIYSSLIYYLYEHHNLEFLASFSFIPVGFFGAILSVFLAFRNNNSYSRWWEARQLWGDLVNASRMTGLEIMTLIASQNPEYSSDQEKSTIRSFQTSLIHRHLAYVNLLRMQLRQKIKFGEVDHYLDVADRERLRNAINPATQLLMVQGQRMKDAQEQGLITDYQLRGMLDTLARFYNIQGACERIKNTPFPREYDGFIRHLIWIMIAIIPVYFLGIFSDDLSKTLIIPITVAVTLIIGFANKAGEIMEDPFENRIHDVPLSALCNTIERDLLQQLGDSTVPEALPVEDHIIW